MAIHQHGFDGSQGNTVTFTPTQAGSVSVTASLENPVHTLMP